MFWPPQLWDEGELFSFCQRNFDLRPQFDWALDTFGGRNPKSDFRHISNIIFSNGELDPWHTGGVLYTVGDAVVISIPNSAHHLDLRLPNALDPAEVTSARAIESD